MCQDREHTPDGRDTHGTHAGPKDSRLPDVVEYTKCISMLRPYGSSWA